jgi:DNA-binding transcriptional LysR family regulator
MDIRRLSAFCAIYDLRSVSRAAEHLHVTQPAVTLHIRRLETELGCRLFRKEGRGIAPTEAGEVLYQSARRILDVYDAGLEQLKGLSCCGEEQVSIGCPTGVLYYLPPLLATLRRKSPDLTVALRTGVCSRICMGVLDKSIEVGIVWEPTVHDALDHERLRTTEFVVIAHPDHPLTSMKAISSRQLCQERLLLPVSESGTRRFLEEKLTGKTLSAAMEFDDVEALKQATKENLGIGFVAKKSVEEEIARGLLHELSVEGQPFERDIFLVTRRGRRLSTGAQLLVNVARNNS